jgi:hypothetical protein
VCAKDPFPEGEAAGIWSGYLFISYTIEEHVNLPSVPIHSFMTWCLVTDYFYLHLHSTLYNLRRWQSVVKLTIKVLRNLFSAEIRWGCDARMMPCSRCKVTDIVISWRQRVFLHITSSLQEWYGRVQANENTACLPLRPGIKLWLAYLQIGSREK